MTTEYEPLRTAHLEAVKAAMIDHTARLRWPRDRIMRYRDHRLRALLIHAAQRSPFHAKRLKGLNLSKLQVSDLAGIPMLTKAEAQDNWDSIITIPGLRRDDVEQMLASQKRYSYFPNGIQVFSSGGSSGVRGVYLWDWHLFVSVACLAWRTQALAEQDEPSRSPARLAVLAAGMPPHASTPLFDIPTTADMQTVVIPVGHPFDEIVSAVEAARPSHLVGYASVIGRLARAALAGDLDVNPVRVSTNSEPLLEEDRAAIQKAWQAPIHNLWGSTEIGVQAVGCGQGEGLHVCEDEVVLERVDDDGRPVGPDEPASRTLATGLANRSFPFIRYDLGDQVNWLSGECPCGSAFARVADIGGRLDDDFQYGKITLPASVFRHVLGLDPRLSEYQVIQTQAGADILAVGSPDVATLTQGLVAETRKYGLTDPMIAVRVVESIPRHQTTSKLRRFVPLPPEQT